MSEGHVVIFTDYGRITGGLDRAALASARGLAQAGWLVDLVCAVAPLDPALFGIPGLRVRSLNWHDTISDPNRLRAFVQGWWNSKASREVSLSLAEFSPEKTVVHFHSYSKSYSASAIRAAQRAGFITILTLHDWFLVCPNGAFYEFPNNRVCHRKPLGFSCLTCQCDSRNYGHKLWRFGRTWTQNVFAGVAKNLSAVVSVSETSRRYAAPHLPANLPIEHIPYPVDVEKLPSADAGKSNAFVFVGRFESYKGAELFALAANRAQVDVIFVGAGPLEVQLRQLLPNAYFAGWQSRQKVTEIVRSSRALVFPSLWPETYGLVCAEALANGIPVIASRGTAAEEYIADGENGLLFERANVDDLAAKLSVMTTKVAERLGRCAYQRYWEAPLTLERHVLGLTTLYKSLLPARGISALQPV